MPGLLAVFRKEMADQFSSRRFMIMFALILLAGLSATYTAAQAIKSAVALSKGDPDALHTLIDLICMTVQLDSQLGHRRASQGVEHFFADAVQADGTVSSVTAGASRS